MKPNDTSVFKGHRERMRAKLQNFGTRYFETYELLEMLLYTVVPRKNTHPTTKLLLKEFSTLSALFSAKPEELTKISGVGKKCAKFINDVGSFLNYEEETGEAFEKPSFSSYEDIGEFFAAYFKAKSENETVILLLDAELRYIDLVKIYSLDLSSGAVQAKPFIDVALKRDASVCAIAHNHPYSSPFPTAGDWETGKALKSAFFKSGLVLLENYVVTEEGYKRFSGEKIQKMNNNECEKIPSEQAAPSAFISFLSKILERSSKNCEEILFSIEKAFKNRYELFEADMGKLKELTNSRSASELIVIIAALASRKETEGFKLGKRHTEDEIMGFIKGYYLNVARESLVILPLDSKGNVLGIELLNDGTVNALTVIPRTILEKLSIYNSQSFIMAHNHPGGVPEPSSEDIASTARLARALKDCGVHLSAHYVVAKGECIKIKIDSSEN